MIAFTSLMTQPIFHVHPVRNCFTCHCNQASFQQTCAFHRSRSSTITSSDHAQIRKDRSQLRGRRVFYRPRLFHLKSMLHCHLCRRCQARRQRPAIVLAFGSRPGGEGEHGAGEGTNPFFAPRVRILLSQFIGADDQSTLKPGFNKPYNCLTMHFFHPRFSSTQPLKPAPEPCSEWAKLHAVQVSQWPKTLVSISDSRSNAVDFLALQHAVEAAMGQACIAIEWVTEGGANQVCLSPSALRYKY